MRFCNLLPWCSILHVPSGSRQGLWLGCLRVSLGDAAGIWGAWFHQGCLLSPVLFLVLMYRVTRCSQGVCPIWEPQDYISAFGHDVVLLPSSVDELQYALEKFAAEYEAAEMRIQKTMGCLLWVGGLGILRLLLERFQVYPSMQRSSGRSKTWGAR